MKTIKDSKLKFKSCMELVKDYDKSGEVGWVQFYGIAFGNKDRDGDIILPGAAKKTLSENLDELQHYLNHDKNRVPGIIHEASEDSYGVLCKSKLMLNTPDGSFAYEYYKACAEANKPVRHSTGYAAVKESQVGDSNQISEIYCAEFSTLTKLAANPMAVGVSVKGFDNFTMDDLLKEKDFYNQLLNAKFSDIELGQLEALKIAIEALIESRAGEPTQDEDEPLDMMKMAELFTHFKNK